MKNKISKSLFKFGHEYRHEYKKTKLFIKTFNLIIKQYFLLVCSEEKILK